MLGLAGSHKYCPKPVTAIVIMAIIAVIMAVIMAIMAVIIAIMAVIMLFMHIYTPCIIASCHVLSVSQPDAPSGPPEVNTELHLRLPQIYKNSQTHHKK